MSLSRVVILSSNSLFAEGVLSRLRAFRNALNLHNVDADDSDALNQIVAIQPTAVIVCASDTDDNANCPLGRLLRELPDVRIIRLDPMNQGYQLVTSELYEAQEIQELLSILKTEKDTDGG